MSRNLSVILFVSLTPPDTLGDLFGDIVKESETVEDYDEGDTVAEIKILEKDYTCTSVIDDYPFAWDNDGDVIVYDYIYEETGSTITWGHLEKQKNELEAWARSVCKRHHCTYRIFVSAHYF